MGNSFHVQILDHGYLKLVDSMGTEESIIEAARMSTGRGFEGWGPGYVCSHCRIRQGTGQEFLSTGDGRTHHAHNWEPTKGDARLLARLYKDQHSTPFEMCQLVVEVQAPIMVFREWHRHRTQSFNEMSARYVQMPNLHYVPEPSRIQAQSATNKQGSGASLPDDIGRKIADDLAVEQAEIYEHYDDLIDAGVAREIARLNTPVSRYSRMRASSNLRNWLHFLHLRMAPGAQWEIRQYANAVAEVIKVLWPRTYSLFEEHTLGAVTLSRSQAAKLAGQLDCEVADLNKKLEEPTP